MFLNTTSKELCSPSRGTNSIWWKSTCSPFSSLFSKICLVILISFFIFQSEANVEMDTKEYDSASSLSRPDMYEKNSVSFPTRDDRSKACPRLTINDLLQSSPEDYDYGKELLLHDSLLREKDTSILSTPFYVDGHCRSPFSQQVMTQLRDLGLGVDSFGNTVSCASVKECNACYTVTGCHWCQDNECHAMGSYYGCIYGSSCEGKKDPCVRTTPEYIGTGSLSVSNTFLVISVGVLSFLFIWACLYLGFACGLSSREKNYQDSYLLLLPNVDRGGLLDQDMDEFFTSNPGPVVGNTNQGPGQTGMQEPRHLSITSTSATSSLPQPSPLHNNNHHNHNVVDHQGNHSTNSLYTPQILAPLPTPRRLSVRGDGDGDRTDRGLIRLVSRNKCCAGPVNTLYNAVRCEKYALYKVFVFIALIFCLAATVAGVIMFPKMPDYSICNKSVKWGSIFEYIVNYKDSAQLDIQFSLYNPNGFGLLLHDMQGRITYKGQYVGKTRLSNVKIDPGTVQDFIILTELAPSIATALEMADDYAEGTLFIDIDMKFDTNLRFWDINLPRFDASYEYQDIDLNKHDQRLNCKCR